VERIAEHYCQSRSPGAVDFHAPDVVAGFRFDFFDSGIRSEFLGFENFGLQRGKMLLGAPEFCGLEIWITG
jgi:hypothetical protein